MGIFLLEVANELQGVNYTIEDLIGIINKFASWAFNIGITLATVTLIVAFIMLIVGSLDNAPRAKQRISLILFGLIGLVLASTIVSLILSLF